MYRNTRGTLSTSLEYCSVIPKDSFVGGGGARHALLKSPALVRAAREYSGKDVQSVSFVNETRLDRALKIIADAGMARPQILLTDHVETYLRIAGYPATILILPDGRESLITQSISDESFRMYVH
jgi:hypothetical protein